MWEKNFAARYYKRLKLKSVACCAKFYIAIQGVPEGKVNILEGCSIGYCEEKKVHMNT